MNSCVRLGVFPTAATAIVHSQLSLSFLFRQSHPHSLLPHHGFSPPTALLVWLVWLTVSLILWLSEFHVVWFSGTSGCLLILDWLLSSFWLCEEVKGFYLHVHLGWNFIVVLIASLWVLCMSSSEKCLFKSLAHFVTELLVFLDGSHVSYLYILYIKPLSEVSLASMFSHMVGSLFILMLFSLAMQKLFILKRSHLIILSFMSLSVGDILLKIFLHGIEETFPPMFSSRTFMVSWLIFKSFIHLEFISPMPPSWPELLPLALKSNIRIFFTEVCGHHHLLIPVSVKISNIILEKYFSWA